MRTNLSTLQPYNFTTKSHILAGQKIALIIKKLNQRNQINHN